MKQCIVITYKSGTSVNIDIPELYYQNKYSKKSSKKIHSKFMKEYCGFVKAMNKAPEVVLVGKYLKFANTTVSGKDVLSIDIKDLSEEVKPQDNTIYIPGVHDQVYLNIEGTDFELLLKEIKDSNLVDNLSKVIEKLLLYFSKSNVELTLKAGKKPPATTRKKKPPVAESSPVVSVENTGK